MRLLGRQFGAVEEVVLRLKELLFPSIADVAVLSVDADIEIVRVIAGLTLPWSSGVVEGHVNRIKMLKRQMFGRAGFHLLRKRVLLYS